MYEYAFMYESSNIPKYHIGNKKDKELEVLYLTCENG